MTDDDGIRLGELEGIVGDEDGYTAEVRRSRSSPGSRHSRRAFTSARCPSSRAARKSACCWRRRSSASREALLLDEPTNYSRSRFHSLAAGLLRSLRRHADRHLARSPLPQQRLHAHRRHRLPDHHHLHRRLRRHGDGQDAGALRIESQNAQREKKIAQLNEFIARFSAGTRSSQVTTAARRKWSACRPPSWRAPTSSARTFASTRCGRQRTATCSSSSRSRKAYGTHHVDRRIHRRRPARRKNLPHGTQRPRQDHPAARPARQLSRPPTTTSASTAAPSCGDTKPRSATSRRTRLDASRRASPPPSGSTVRPAGPREEIRGMLGQMLFCGEEGEKQTKALSGGEQARLVFCKLMLHQAQHPHLRRADEPPRPRSDQRAQHRAAALRRHRPAGHPRSRPDRRSRHPPLELRPRRHRRLPGPLLRSGRANTTRAGELHTSQISSSRPTNKGRHAEGPKRLSS